MIVSLILLALIAQDPPTSAPVQAPSQTEIDWGFRLEPQSEPQSEPLSEPLSEPQADPQPVLRAGSQSVAWAATPAVPTATVRRAEAPPSPSSEVQSCLSNRFADGSVTDACRPILETERALIPADMLATPGVWVQQSCARENLRPGQTTLDCRTSANVLVRRATVANDALEGRLPPTYGRLSASIDRQATPPPEPTQPQTQPENGWRRQCTQENRRDPDGRESTQSSSCSVTWTSTTRH